MRTKALQLLGLAGLMCLWVVACGGGGSSTPAPVTPPVVEPQPLPTPVARTGIGIGALSYYDRSVAMADLARHTQVLNFDWSEMSTLDAIGQPLKDFRLIYSASGIPLAAGTYKLMFDGRANVSAGGKGVLQNRGFDAATNRSTADLVLSATTTENVWLDFVDTYRTPSSAKGDGLTNIRLWRPGYPVDGSVTFTSEFVTAMKKFMLIRGMDFVSANLNPQTRWSERTRPTHFASTGVNGQSWELMVALANATDRDIWLNVPVRADDDYILKLAQLVRYGSDGDQPYTSAQAKPVYAPLKAGLRVYLEYGNEIWNAGPGFQGFGWALALANTYKGQTSHPIAFDGAQSDQYVALRRWVAYRSAFISLKFREVFGDAAMMNTVRPIFAAQAGDANAYLSTGLLWAQAFHGQVRATPANPKARTVNELWYGGGGAAYYDSSVDPKDTAASTLTAYFDNLPNADFTNRAIIDSIWTHGFGLNYVAYEGGPGPGGSALGSVSGAAVSATYNNDPRMKDRMLVAQTLWEQAGGDALVYYVYSSTSPWSFTNELTPGVVSDTTSVKLQAIDAINLKSKAAPTLGSLVPGRVALKSAGAQVIGSDAATWAAGGSAYLLRPGSDPAYILVPVRASAAGTLQVSLSVAEKVSGSVALHVNGVRAGSLVLSNDAASSSTLSSKLSVSLPQGLSVLRLDAPAGGDVFVKELIFE